MWFRIALVNTKKVPSIKKPLKSWILILLLHLHWQKIQCWLLVLRYLIFPQFPLALPFKDWRQHFLPGPLTAAGRFLFLLHRTTLLSACKGPGSFPWCCFFWTSVNNIISALETFEITSAAIHYEEKAAQFNHFGKYGRTSISYKRGIQHTHRSLLQSFTLPIITARFCEWYGRSPTFKEEKNLHGFYYLG